MSRRCSSRSSSQDFSLSTDLPPILYALKSRGKLQLKGKVIIIRELPLPKEVSEHPESLRQVFHLTNEEAMEFAHGDLDIQSCATYQQAEAWANNARDEGGLHTPKTTGTYAALYALHGGEKKRKASSKKPGCYVILDFGPDHRQSGPPRQRIFKDWDTTKRFTDGFSATRFRGVKPTTEASCAREKRSSWTTTVPTLPRTSVRSFA